MKIDFVKIKIGSPYEETARWFRKLIGTGRGRVRHQDHVDAFDWLENIGADYFLKSMVLLAAFALETIALPLVLGNFAWEWIKSKWKR